MDSNQCNEIKLNLESAQKALGLLRPAVEVYLNEKENRAESAVKVDELRSKINELRPGLRLDKLILEERAIPKTITIGGKDADRLETDLRNNFKITSSVGRVMQQPAFKDSLKRKQEKIALVVVRVADLGFPKGATAEEIFRKIKDFGLGSVPAEVGPRLRLQLKVISDIDYVVIGMEPISDPIIGESLFSWFSSGGEYWLDCSYGKKDHYWDGSFRFVFARLEQ